MSLQRSTAGVCHTLLWFPNQMVPACRAKVSRTNIPSCTMWFKQFTKYVTKCDHKVWCHPHSIEHDTQPIAYLISKQVVSYRTRGGTYFPGVSTPKISVLSRFEHGKPHHLMESNRLHHSNLAQTTTSILTIVKSHLDGWETISHKDTSQTQHHKGWKDLYNTHDCMTKHN
jgi:hypothetical protein